MPALPAIARTVYLLVLAVCLSAMGAAYGAPTSPLRFQRLGGVGIDNLAILALVQDRQGFTWIGTTAGLYRYDGYRATRYLHDPLDESSLPHDRVADIIEDRHGRIWAGTQQGLVRFDPETDSFTRFRPPHDKSTQPRLIVKAISADGQGGLWVATWGGLQHFNPDTGKFVLYMHDRKDPGSIGSNDINALALDAKGGLWMTTWPGGLDYLAPGSSTFDHYRIDDPAKPDGKLNNSRALLMDSEQNLWIGNEKGVVRWRSGTPWATRERLDAPENRIQHFYHDSEGAVWAGTLSAGLLRWEKGSRRAERYQHRASDPYSVPSDDVRAIMQDRGGMLWIGTLTDGISLVNRNSRGFRRFIPFDATSNTMPGNALQVVEGAPGNRLWLGNTRGLALFDPVDGTVHRLYQAAPGKPGSLSNNIVYSMYQQPGGPLWVGTASGLNRLDPATGKFDVQRFDRIASGFINVIEPGRGNVLWLGTGGDLIRFHPASGKWTTFPHIPGDPDSRSATGTTTIVEDRHGRVWMGSEWNGGGLDMLDPASGKFRHFKHEPGRPGTIADNNISNLYEDPTGRLWVGTSKGINEVLTGPDGKISFRSFTGPGSFGLSKVLAIRTERSGKLWISTATGLTRMDPDSGKVDRFTASDGLSEGFNLGTAYATRDGTLYFGGTKGMSAVYPEQVRVDSVPPQVAITDITVLNRSVKDQRDDAEDRLTGSVTVPRLLTLSPKDVVFSIEFAALHYTQPMGNRYAYRLTGFDRDWVSTNAERRMATYTNLDPGDYLFEVKAANHRGVWTDDVATLTVRILPPFWKTWWFKGLFLLLLSTLLIATHRLRVQRLTRQQEKLRALVAERTRELEESNAKLEALTTTDELTGVGNRRGFDLALAQEWRRARRSGQCIALAMLDVDHFKSYNDRYGHQAGDECLREAARVVADHARRPTDVVARYGGEEFVLLATGVDIDQAMSVARDICQSLERLAMPHEGSPLGVVTISIGVAVTALNGSATPENLIEQADKALYSAKQAGRNRAVLASSCQPDRIAALRA